MRVVLDTNVVLDLWCFRQPTVMTLARALEAGALLAVGTPAMRAELAHVLDRAARGQALGRRWSGEAMRRAMTPVLCTWDRLVHCVEPPSTLAGSAPICSDPQDQPFVDLSLAHRVRALLTRDRALLRLTRALNARGVTVAKPELWDKVLLECHQQFQSL